MSGWLFTAGENLVVILVASSLALVIGVLIGRGRRQATVSERISGYQVEPPKPERDRVSNTVTQLQEQIRVRDARIAELAASLAEARTANAAPPEPVAKAPVPPPPPAAPAPVEPTEESPVESAFAAALAPEPVPVVKPEPEPEPEPEVHADPSIDVAALQDQLAAQAKRLAYLERQLVDDVSGGATEPAAGAVSFDVADATETGDQDTVVEVSIEETGPEDPEADPSTEFFG